MKSSIAQLLNIYKPQQHKKNKTRLRSVIVETPRHKNSSINISLVSKRTGPAKKDNSLRSISVNRRKEKHQYLRNNTRSTEPYLLPSIKSTTPDMRTPTKSVLKLSTLDLTFEEDIRRLDTLISRNQTARNDLLSVQKQIIDLGVKQLIKNRRFLSMHQGIEYISLEQIDESLKEASTIDYYDLDTRKTIFRRTKLPPLC